MTKNVKSRTAIVQRASGERIDHPAHYGGADDPFEAIKVIEAWGLGFHLGNTVKYISRAGKKGDALEDLKKAKWYLDREISLQIADVVLNYRPKSKQPNPCKRKKAAKRAR